MPQININSPADQQFVWIIPTNSTTQTSQFALKTYEKPYYLGFTGADLKASLRKGDPSTNTRFRLDKVS